MIPSSASESVIARRRAQWLRVLRAGARCGTPPSAWRPAAGGGPAVREQPRRVGAGSPAALDAIADLGRLQPGTLWRILTQARRKLRALPGESHTASERVN
jgi:hypothetical protein